MSCGPWDREPVTGLPRREFERIDDSYLLGDGSLDTARFPDCNVFNPTSAAWLACGWVNVARIEAEMVADPRYPWRPICNENGLVVTMATHTNTAVAWGAARAAANRARADRDPRLQNLKPFRVRG